jgi:SH3-like domain-containing protein
MLSTASDWTSTSTSRPSALTAVGLPRVPRFFSPVPSDVQARLGPHTPASDRHGYANPCGFL